MEYKATLTTCPYCGCGCGLFLEALDGRLVGTTPSQTSPVNQGRLCVKGWNAHEFVHNPRRITEPLVRKNGQLTPVSWDEALDHATQGIKRVVAAKGGDAVGFLTSARVTNEENYLLQKFARAGVGTNSVDHCARLWHSSTVAGLAAAFGSGAMTNSIEELADADVIFVIGSNTTTSHPLIATRLFRAKAKGAKIIVADPRKIQVAFLADIHVRQNLGSDAALINGMMHVILAENLANRDFMAQHTEGFEDMGPVLARYTPEVVERITGVAADDIRAMARTYATADKASICYCMGITQHTSGVDNVKSLANLALIAGQIGRPSTGVNPLRGQNNVQGACDMGGLPDVYPGYQKVDDEKARAKFEAAWGVSLNPKPGLKIPDMLDGMTRGEVKALWVVGENPVMSDPDCSHVKHALGGLDVLIVQDIFLTETAQLADVVLPGASFAEKDGTFSNTERRVQRVRKAIEPLPGTKPDWEIIQEIARRHGLDWNYADPEAVFTEIAAVTPQYAGISYARLEGDGLCWPCPTAEHPGTPYLHKDGNFARGKGKFHAVEHQDPAEVIDDQYPFWLTTGRTHVHYHTGTMTRNSRTLNAQMPEGFCEINPIDAASLGITEGQILSVSTRRGTIQAPAMITDRVNPGVLFLPFHFIESCANVLTNPAHDPLVKIPEYKVCAAQVKKAA